jgi:hypothetical protein
MNYRNSIIVLLALIQFFFASTFHSFGQGSADTRLTAVALNGTWNGIFYDDEGSVFQAAMHLKVSDDGVIEGDIKWTLKKAPGGRDQSKVGHSGIEYVKGKYDSSSHVLTFAGNRSDDPDQVIALDNYKLFFADNGQVIGGISKNQGNWRGMLSLSRGKTP